MNAVGAFIPIIFIFLIIWGIFYIIQSKNKNQLTQKHKKQRFYLSNKRIFWMVISYMLILILAAGIYAFIPQKHTPAKVYIDDAEYDKISNHLYDAINTGNIEQIDPSFISSKWEKKYTGKQLKIVAPEPDDITPTIIVERKTTDDKLIEGIFYKTKSYVDSIDVTEKVPSDQLKWSNNTLTLIPPKPVKLNFALFHKDMTLKQFTEEPSLRDDDFNSSFGFQILYLRIPKDLKIIESEEIGIQYVGDSN
ncbi:hypothetical protein B5V89_11140 [Heyndrickxia sporothermodurans]|uniref:hypothetical protein n=1 Tax=Heyndrickxia sporothermodurans TaxID=46224 RepID=UPI000D3CED03|nr:hypothetical protein [Heyndrickxia sporothermodurans]PTY78023.1 hypothetical protein B5V89_11140 [Heyndrickxia sporothermodurans]